MRCMAKESGRNKPTVFSFENSCQRFDPVNMDSFRRAYSSTISQSASPRLQHTLLTKVEKAHRFQEQWLGHLFAKACALGLNVFSLGTAFWYSEFGSDYEKVINHGIFGTIPVHIMSIFMLVMATKFSREMSIIHDYMCTGICLTVAFVLYFGVESESPTPLLMFTAGVMLAFDIAIHIFTERI